jgi:hypothetical protein
MPANWHSIWYQSAKGLILTIRGQKPIARTTDPSCFFFMAKSPKRKPQALQPRPKTATSAPKPADKQAQPISSVRSPEPVAAPVTVDPLPTNASGFELIRFDTRVRWFLGICVGLFIILTIMRVNYSSVGIYNQLLPDGGDIKRGLVTGTPKMIRMDEWGSLVPLYLSQANNNFPDVNLAVGGVKTPVASGLSHHISVIFRPELWGFFLFDVETGFAWMWNFNVFFCLVSIAFLLLFLTGNNFWLSIIGSLWLSLSPANVWWSIYPSSYLQLCAAAFVSLIYLLGSKNRGTILINGLLFGALTLAFILHIYPPFQISFGYIFVFLSLGILFKHYGHFFAFEVPVKLSAFFIALVVIGLGGWSYYTASASTIKAMMGTVYPGQRLETGGGGFVANYFSEFYRWLISDQQYPSNWFNICELSHYVNFAHIIIPAVLVVARKTRRIDPVILALIIFIAICYIYIDFGIPAVLAKATLLSNVQASRLQLGLGVASLFLTILYLSDLQKRAYKTSSLETTVLVVFVGLITVYAAWVNLTDAANNFFTVSRLIAPSFFFLLMGLLLVPFGYFKYRTLLFGIGIIGFSMPNLKVNPVNIGLSAVTDHVLYKTVRDIHSRDPKAGWLVLGNQLVSYIVTATGVNELSGVKNVPDIQTMRVLDPTGRNDSIYNRYAHSIYYPYIDGRDSTVFRVNEGGDGFNVGIDPCSPKLKKLNMKYIVFDHQPQAAEIRCMTQVSNLGSLSIYRIND